MSKNGSTTLTPELICKAFIEFNAIFDDCEHESLVEQIIDSDGHALCAAIAARHAFHRVGKLWPIVDQLERFFAGVGGHPSADRAREIIGGIRDGSIDIREDGGLDHVRTSMQHEITALQSAEGVPTDVVCLLHVADLACWTWSGHTFDNSEVSAARICFRIGYLLDGHLVKEMAGLLDAVEVPARVAARALVAAYQATADGAAISEPMRARLCSVVAGMPHLFTTVDSVHLLRASCDKIDAMRET